MLSFSFNEHWQWINKLKHTVNIVFSSEYKEPTLPCNWLMTQAALHITKTDVTYEQIIGPQQVQHSLFFSSCSSCSSMFSLCILKTSAKVVSIFLSPFSPFIYSQSSAQWILILDKILAVSVCAGIICSLRYKGNGPQMERRSSTTHLFCPTRGKEMFSKNHVTENIKCMKTYLII